MYSAARSPPTCPAFRADPPGRFTPWVPAISPMTNVPVVTAPTCAATPMRGFVKNGMSAPPTSATTKIKSPWLTSLSP